MLYQIKTRKNQHRTAFIPLPECGRSLLLFLIFFTASCTTISRSEPTPSIALSMAALPLQFKLTQEGSFIGFVRKFSTTNEFYTTLYFKQDFTERDYEELIHQGDSVIYKDDEMRRTRVPLKIARRYFDLSGIDSIHIFNGQSMLQGVGKLERIEFLEDFIESQFIAVFRVPAAEQIADYEFCIGNFPFKKSTIVKNEYEISENKAQSEQFSSFLNLTTKNLIWKAFQCKSVKSNKLFSILSADSTAYIARPTPQGFKLLFQSDFDEMINSCIPLAWNVNGMPILLVEAGKPETDMLWESVLVFDGSHYVRSRTSRVKLN